MKIRRIVKRLAAVGTGVAMLGATAMGALAADLKDYPTMFVTNGTFNGFLVVGEKAAAIDNLAMTDIAASMKYNKPAAETSATTTVEGDAWKVGTSAKYLELCNSTNSDSLIVGESFNTISSFITSDELKALADGTWATNENSYAYQQFLYFDDATGISGIVKYTEDDNDLTGDRVYFASGGHPIARYKIEFSSTAQSDIENAAGTADTTGVYLTDFEDTTLKVLGRDYTIVQARRDSANDRSIKLTLMGGAASDSLQELEEKSYTVNGKEYQVKLSYVDSTYAKFIVNGESTAKIQDGSTYVLADKIEIGVNNVLYQSYAGGIHSADFFIGAEKVVFYDTDVSAAITGDQQLKVGSENIDGTVVKITGSDNNVTFTISTIEVNMTADSDYWIVPGGKLSDAIVSQGDEEEVLMNGAFDIEYKGLTKETTHDIKLKTSSARRYKLEVYDGDGIAVDLPVAYADAQYNLSMGQESNGRGNNNREALVLKEGVSIYKDDYFVVTSGTDSAGSAKSYLMQYKGADSTGKTSPKIKFKNMGSAETLEYSATSMAVGNPATIKLGGYSFIAYNTSGADADDYQILVDLDGGGGAIGTNIVTFVDSYGPTVTFNYNQSSWSNVTEQDWVGMVISTGNLDDYDTVQPAVINLTITGITSDLEVRSAIRIDGGTSNLLMPSGVTDVAYGYTSMGTYITYGTPSSDPQYVTLTYPKKQLLPQVYVTSGATTSSTSTSGGTLTAVVVVDATKLDSEISDEKAQNLIVIGGPCVNTVSAKLLGSPAVCTEGFAPGKARVKLFEQTNGNVAMLVAGYSGADTRLAGSVIAHRASEMFGTEVEIEGTTSSDATISAPAPVVAAPVVEAPVTG